MKTDERDSGERQPAPAPHDPRKPKKPARLCETYEAQLNAKTPAQCPECGELTEPAEERATSETSGGQ